MAMPYPAYGAPRPPPPSEFESYPPNHNTSFTSGYSAKQLDDDRRHIARTPSPTPSEAKALNDGIFNWRELFNWRFWARKEWIKYYIIIFVIAVCTSLITIFHTQIVDALTPATNWLHGLKYGYLVPIGILFVISFPPLFGHEIVAVLCGLVWGLWIGFAIVAAGTFLGEVGNFYAFKYCCRARGEKMERTQIQYACLARCVRTGGFRIALIARFSAIPGHFTTAVFSTCGMNIFVFSVAAILSLPKQLITVYLGVILEQSKDGVTDPKSRYISDGVLALTLLVTVLAMWYILHQMALVKASVIYDRRKARQGKLAMGALEGSGVGSGVYGNPGMNDSNDSSLGYDPRASLSDIPLTAKGGNGGTMSSGTSSATAVTNLHPRYDYEQQQKQRQYAEWAAQQRQYSAQQRGRPTSNSFNPPPQQQQYQEEQHQQWDAQGRAVGYTPGPVGQVMYAPQPTRVNSGPPPPGRAEIQPGAAEVYAHGRGTAVTGDEVGWDMQQAQMRERERAQQQAYTQSPPQQQQYRSPPPPQQLPQQQQYAPETQTPTQAQYATAPMRTGMAAGIASSRRGRRIIRRMGATRGSLTTMLRRRSGRRRRRRRVIGRRGG
ncbi:hypothetical protein C8R46DRAFT_1058148, partial [Mycena filopes]